MDAFTPNAFAHKIWLILFSTKFWLKPFLRELITTVSMNISWSKCLNFWTSGVVNKVTRILLKQGADTHVIKDLSIDLWQLFLYCSLPKGWKMGKVKVLLLEWRTSKLWLFFWASLGEAKLPISCAEGYCWVLHLSSFTLCCQ